MSRPATRNKAFLAAYQRGYEAGRNGAPRRNPYGTAKCLRRNGGAWTGVYRNYWDRGWGDGRKATEGQK